MQTNLTQPVTKVTNYLEIAPVMNAMKTANDKMPKNSLPQDVMGTIQENAHNIPPVTLYNSHGILTKTEPNTLLGYA